MSRIEKVYTIAILLLMAACMFLREQLKTIEADLKRTQEEWKTLWIAADETFRTKELNACHCGKKVAAAPPSCPRSKFCPCTPPCQCSECRCGGITIKTKMVRPPRSGMGVEIEPSDCLKKKSALPAPGTPLLTAVVHDGKARIAWIDSDGQRQERTMTEEEFCQLNTKGE